MKSFPKAPKPAGFAGRGTIPDAAIGNNSTKRENRLSSAEAVKIRSDKRQALLARRSRPTASQRVGEPETAAHMKKKLPYGN